MVTEPLWRADSERLGAWGGRSLNDLSQNSQIQRPDPNLPSLRSLPLAMTRGRRLVSARHPTGCAGISYIINYHWEPGEEDLVEFRWNDWNIEHVEKHGVDPDEAEEVVTRARAPYPVGRSDDKYLVWGPGRADRLLQVVFVLDDDETGFVIHARPLTDAEKHRFRRRQK